MGWMIVALVLAGQADDLQTKLGKAAQKADIVAVEQLLKDGAKANEHCWLWPNALFAIEGKPTERLAMAKLLVAHGADAKLVDRKTGLSVLNRAMTIFPPFSDGRAEGIDEYIRYLLDHGAPVDSAPNYSYTPLQLSVIAGNIKVANLLLDRGANAKVRTPKSAGFFGVRSGDLWNRKPFPEDRLSNLFLLTQNWNDDLAKRLTELGCDPKEITPDGYTMLEYACFHRNLAAMRAAFTLGIDPNRESKNGDRPLHVSIYPGAFVPCKPVIEELLAHKANPALTNKKGETPADMVRRMDKEFNERPSTKMQHYPIGMDYHMKAVEILKILENKGQG